MKPKSFLLALCLLWPGLSNAGTVNVMTSYPQPMLAVYQQAFEQANPDLQLNILWRRPDDALKVLTAETSDDVDVYWTPSVRTFQALAEADKLAPLSLDNSDLPQLIGQARISDAQGRYHAAEIAGYGMLINVAKSADHGLPVPQRWQDLQHDQWRDKIALPVPSEVGYAPMLIEQLLQARDWSAGWNQWRRIAANSRLIGRGAGFVSEQVLDGRVLVGLTMDFFALSSLEDQPAYRFVYPQQTAFNPAHIAIMKSSSQPDAAKRFVEFVLSVEGQSLLQHPDIRKLPVRPSLYRDGKLPLNPFTSAGSYDYSHVLGLARREFNAMLFDAAITLPHEALSMAWQLLDDLEQQDAAGIDSNRLAELQAKLTHWPIAEPADDDPILLACAARHDDEAAAQQCDQVKQAWHAQFAARYGEIITELRALQSSS